MIDRDLVRLCARSYGAATWRAGGVEALFFETRGYAAIAFRGTEFDATDILRDIRGVPWRDRDLGWCHAGFAKGVRRIWPRIAIDLAALKRPLYLTGHSKGGAEATIAAAICRLAGRPVAGLVTFGSPRVGYAKLGHVLAGVSVRRYVNGADCVPSHPWPVWGYRHIGDVQKIGQKTNKARERFADHRMAVYIAAIETAAAQR